MPLSETSPVPALISLRGLVVSRKPYAYDDILSILVIQEKVVLLKQTEINVNYRKPRKGCLGKLYGPTRTDSRA